MIEVRRATLEDIINSAVLAKEVYKGEGDLVPGMLNNLRGGECHAFIGSDGSLFGVVGGVIIWPGVADIGAILTDNTVREPIGFVRRMRQYISEMMEKHNLHRVQMAVKADYATGHKWAAAIGFKAEGVLKSYSESKEDYVMYGRVK